jgi:hypothetical protein
MGPQAVAQPAPVTSPTPNSEEAKFFVSPTSLNRWAGPYKSLHHATTAIARKLSHEYVQRNRRLTQLKEQRP